MDSFELFLWGVAGAMLAEVLNARTLYENNRRRWNSEKKKIAYWGFAILFAAAGGVTALAHEQDGVVLSRWLALNVGFTWPLVIRRGIGALPAEGYEDVD